MYRMLFTNRWAALAFVAIMVLSALAFVSTGAKDVNKLTRREATGAPRIGSEQYPQRPAEAATASKVAEAVSSDDDLIDLAKGSDPTPSGEAGNDDDGWGTNTGSASGPSGSGDPWNSMGSTAAPAGDTARAENAGTVSMYPPGVETGPKQGTFPAAPAQ